MLYLLQFLYLSPFSFPQPRPTPPPPPPRPHTHTLSFTLLYILFTHLPPSRAIYLPPPPPHTHTLSLSFSDCLCSLYFPLSLCTTFPLQSPLPPTYSNIFLLSLPPPSFYRYSRPPLTIFSRHTSTSPFTVLLLSAYIISKSKTLSRLTRIPNFFRLCNL